MEAPLHRRCPEGTCCAAVLAHDTGWDPLECPLRARPLNPVRARRAQAGERPSSPGAAALRALPFSPGPGAGSPGITGAECAELCRRGAAGERADQPRVLPPGAGCCWGSPAPRHDPRAADELGSSSTKRSAGLRPGRSLPGVHRCAAPRSASQAEFSRAAPIFPPLHASAAGGMTSSIFRSLREQVPAQQHADAGALAGGHHSSGCSPRDLRGLLARGRTTCSRPPSDVCLEVRPLDTLAVAPRWYGLCSLP